MSDLRNFIKNSIRECLNEREDSEKVNYYTSIVDNIISKHQKNLKDMLTIDYNTISNRELKNNIHFVINKDPRYNVYFGYTDGIYKGEVTKLNGIQTIMIYDNEYYDQLDEFTDAVMYNKNKLKFYKKINDLSKNEKIKSTLFHELVHIYDKINYDDTEKINTKFTNMVNKNIDNIDDIHHNLYSNRTTEYNAYFLQRAKSYTKNGSFDDFKNYMVDIPIYKSMNDDLKKKYLNRVYSYFQSSVK